MNIKMEPEWNVSVEEYDVFMLGLLQTEKDHIDND